jgi:hypothetical protein
MPKRIKIPEGVVLGKIEKKRKPYPKRKKERCQICKKVMEGVSPGHLREHGWTVERYRRCYGVLGPVSGPSSVSIDMSKPDNPNDILIQAVGDRLTSSKQWVACIADEVGERILGGPLRQRLSVLLTTMLYQRAEVHGKALAILSGSLEELQSDWRMSQGGENGGPTDTDTLLRMVEKAGKLVKDSEDAVQRTIKLALDEQRLAADTADALGPALYQGTGENLNMPAGMTTGDRETIRNLLSLVGKAANDHGTVDATSQVISEEDIEKTTEDTLDATTPQGGGARGASSTTLPEGSPSSATDSLASNCGSVSDPTTGPAGGGGAPTGGSDDDIPEGPSTTPPAEGGRRGTPRNTDDAIEISESVERDTSSTEDAIPTGAPKNPGGDSETVARDTSLGGKKKAARKRAVRKKAAKNGTRKLYHRSFKSFKQFKTTTEHAFGSRAREQPLFFKESLAEAMRMWNVGPYLYTCNVKLGRLFDPRDMYRDDAKYTDDVDSLTALGRRVLRELFNGDEDSVFYMLTGAYDIMESSETLDWLQRAGYDSFLVSESGKLYRDRSIAVFDPSRITIIKASKLR